MALWLEDFATGEVARFGAYVVTREELIAFATAYDPQPFHLDDAAAAASPIFGKLAASGWHTAGMTMRMTVDYWQARGGASLASPGIDELRFLKPVHVGDTLSVEVEVLATRALASRADRGIVTFRSRTLNQSGEAVLSFVATTFWPRRDGAAGAA